MIILASGSPRRRVLLREAGIRFRVVRQDYEEKDKRGVTPRRLVLEHALGKARSVAASDGTIVAADTVVYFDKKIIGKPKDLNDARRILGKLQGAWHAVWTGVAILEKKDGRIRRQARFAVRTQVRLRDMTPLQIRSYYRRVNPLDKAGAYAIQSRRPIVESVRGSFSNAVGLPMEKLRAILTRKFLNS